METKTELKTIHDLPQEIKDVYSIKEDSDSIGSPSFVGFQGMEYLIEKGESTYEITIPNKCVINIWINVKHLHITILKDY